MTYRSSARLYAVIAAILLLPGAPAHAQIFSFGPGPALGEEYRVEGAVDLWSPSADIAIASESLGITGTTIDARDDLGLTDDRFGAFRATLRATRRNKLRFQFIPIRYEQAATTDRDIIFNGQRYRAGLPVASSVDWKAYRFGYEFDVVRWDRGFAGVVLDLKYTDVRANLTSEGIEEFARARALIPAVGGIFRAYLLPSVAITGELTGFKLPRSVVEDASGHYVDLDIYGTINLTRNIGAQFGYRSFDLGYTVDTDIGDFDLRGVYFGAVFRY